jgi:hypothetical protein
VSLENQEAWVIEDLLYVLMVIIKKVIIGHGWGIDVFSSFG